MSPLPLLCMNLPIQARQLWTNSLLETPYKVSRSYWLHSLTDQHWTADEKLNEVMSMSFLVIAHSTAELWTRCHCRGGPKSYWTVVGESEHANTDHREYI